MLDHDAIAKPGQSIRLHVTRSTDYGDRFKLFRVTTPEQAQPADQGLYGVTLEQDQEDKAYYVTDMEFNGPLEQAGLDFGDKVTKIDVEQENVPQLRSGYTRSRFGYSSCGSGHLTAAAKKQGFRRFRYQESA